MMLRGALRPLSRLAAMRGRTQITLLACVCAAALAGCGSEDEGTIPQDDSDRLITLLDGIDENVAGGNCDIARDQVDEFNDAVNDLPAEVDDEVKQGIQEAAGRLAELSDDPSQCDETTGETGFDQLEPTTEPTTTEAPTTTETTTTETEKEAPPDTGAEDGGGPSQGPGGGGASGPGPGGGGPTSGETGEGEVTIEPGTEEPPTSGGIGEQKVPRP
jgi:hypothetical protein